MISTQKQKGSSVMIKSIKSKYQYFSESWKVQRFFAWAWGVFAVTHVIMGEWSLAISHVLLSMYAFQIMETKKDKQEP
jgi:hypothetical protein